MQEWTRVDLKQLLRSRKSGIASIVFMLATCYSSVYLEVPNINSASQGSNSLGMFLQWVPLFAISAWLIANTSQPIWTPQFFGNPAWWILLVMCAVSALWSDLPVVVLKRSIQNLGVMFIVLAAARYYHDQFVIFLQKLLVCTGLILWASVVVALTMPQLGIETAVGIEGTWRGIAGQKNLLGIISALTIFWTVVCWRHQQINRWLAVFMLMAAFICLIMSKSSTSAALTMTSLLVYFAIEKPRINSPSLIYFVFICISLLYAALSLLYFFAETEFPSVDYPISIISTIFGKESHLTGRSDIWELMWASIAKHPIFGMGFSSFWMGPGGPSQFISDTLRWTVPSAHNGYLEIINELGLLGLFVFVAAILHHVVNIFKLMAFNRSDAAIHAGMLTIFLISNASESTALRLFFLLQMTIAVSMCVVVMQLNAYRQQPAPT